MQMDHFDSTEEAVARSLLDELLEASRLYKTGPEFKALLDFVVRLRNFAPFNAMLLQVQKPGLTYAASARDWRERFRRFPKPGARPLVILWPFGPVAFVYDVMDTDGEPLPAGVNPFAAEGEIDEGQVRNFYSILYEKDIKVYLIDCGDGDAGSIKHLVEEVRGQELHSYQLKINRNHTPSVQFATLAHELAHLFLGHIGENPRFSLSSRRGLPHEQEEIEAEGAAYIVCARNGVASRSESYLCEFVSRGGPLPPLDAYQIMRAAGAVEKLLGLAAHTRFEPPKYRPRRRRRVADGARRPLLFGDEE